MSNRVLSVFNTCGISGRENVQHYVESIKGIVDQKFEGHQVALSSCKNSPQAIQHLKENLGDSITYNLIDDIVPVNVSFNHTVRKNVEHFGEFESYLYIDSGMTFFYDSILDQNVVSKLYSLHKEKNCAMTSGRVDRDSGIQRWLGIDHPDEMTKENRDQYRKLDSHIKIPIGKTVNLHIQLFDNSIYKFYDRKLMPDVFASFCSESIHSYICASLGKNFYLSKDVFLPHETSMDMACSGNRPEWAKQKKGIENWQHTFALPYPETINNILKNPEMWDSGCGYEILENVAPHNPDCYDENEKCKDPERLGNFILDNFYLKKWDFNYDDINSVFIP